MDNKERFIELCKGIHREGIDDLMNWLEKSDFYTAPASQRYHGDYAGGLLDHSLNVYDELMRIFHAYRDVVNSSIESLLIVSLFHDLCKVNFYASEKRNRKNANGQWESYDCYTINEKMKYGGHGSKSVFIVQSFIKLTPEEAIAINNHMGAFCDDWKNVGGAYEMYPLAWLLSVADQAATFLIENKK